MRAMSRITMIYASFIFMLGILIGAGGILVWNYSPFEELHKVVKSNPGPASVARIQGQLESPEPEEIAKGLSALAHCPDYLVAQILEKLKFTHKQSFQNALKMAFKNKEVLQRRPNITKYLEYRVELTSEKEIVSYLRRVSASNGLSGLGRDLWRLYSRSLKQSQEIAALCLEQLRDPTSPSFSHCYGFVSQTPILAEELFHKNQDVPALNKIVVETRLRKCLNDGKSARLTEDWIKKSPLDGEKLLHWANRYGHFLRPHLRVEILNKASHNLDTQKQLETFFRNLPVACS